MKRLYLLYLLLLNGLFLCAQSTLNERVYVHLDKDCYVAGEDMLLKFYTVDSHYKPSSFSKVGYIEICNIDKPHIQVKLALNQGVGAGKVTIPLDMPSGIYQLSGYTRYMRNEGEEVLFKRQIAVVNMAANSDADRIELVDPQEKYPQVDNEVSNISVSVDKSKYSNRSQVNLSLANLPDDVTDMVISVYRNDSIAYLPQVDKKDWLKRVTQTHPITLPWKWLPEYEGHIITGRIGMSDADEALPDHTEYSTNIGFVGNDIRYIQGKKEGELAYFYTGDIYGPQEIVTSVAAYDDKVYRMDLLSPFLEQLPQALPSLRLSAEDKKLMDRFVGVQLQQVIGVDSLGQKVPLEQYYYFRTPIVYDLDQYTRFSTLGETIIEFIGHIVVRKGKLDRRVMKVLIPDENRFSMGNTLVLLDGTPILNHEEMLAYNPRNIRMISIYDGKYLFGGEIYECMIHFVSHRQNLSAIHLNDASQLLPYDCPLLPEKFTVPMYSDEKVREALTPDFRHTLYWNPFGESIVNGRKSEMSFYTSDLSGEYKVVVEGFTKTGKSIYGTTFFSVSE